MLPLIVRTILIVDDQQELRENLYELLTEEKFHVLGAGNGIEALEILQQYVVDLIIADVAMPHMNGYQLYEQVRANPHWVHIPFLFLSARTMNSDIRYGKELGVDDYLTKPYDRADLLAAVRGRLRRSDQLAHVSDLSRQSAPINPEMILGRLRVSPSQHKAWMDYRPLDLSAREFKLLLHLAEHAEHVVKITDLIRVTHGYEADAEEASNLLRPFVRSLRRKLGYPVGEDGPIETVRGVGYRIVPPT
jgi:DNA-binding response OmpR family regulator